MRNSRLAKFAALAACLAPALRAEDAQVVLSRMDRESATFRQITAKLKKVNYISVLSDSNEETGAIWIRRGGRGIEMRTEIDQPEPKSVGLAGSTVKVYFPKIKTVQIWELDKYRALTDQLLLLGFGSSGKEIQRNYMVQAAGEENVGAVKTTRLELVPKSAKVLEQIKRVDLWVPLDAGYPVQQKFLQSGGDYYLVTYSEIKLNPNLPENAFRLKLPSGVKEEHPQK